MSDKLAEDWVSLWQSELSAMGADRELRESFMAMVSLWGATATSTLAALRTPHDSPHRKAPPPQPPGPSPPPPAPVARLDEIEQLHRRIVELEQRLALFERNRAIPS